MPLYVGDVRKITAFSISFVRAHVFLAREGCRSDVTKTAKRHCDIQQWRRAACFGAPIHSVSFLKAPL